MKKLTDIQEAHLENVIRLASNINTIAIDCIDGYAKFEQAKREIKQCMKEIERSLED